MLHGNREQRCKGPSLGSVEKQEKQFLFIITEQHTWHTRIHTHVFIFNNKWKTGELT